MLHETLWQNCVTVADQQTLTDGVVKLGGSVLANPDLFARALSAIQDCSSESRLLIVPGGGTFADAVREADRRLGLSDETAHWMAVLAMDQMAHVVAERLGNSRIVSAPVEIMAALVAGQVPVLAPSRWLRETDPLPHSWEVTSDSIAAWAAGQVGAEILVLIKPSGVGTPSGVSFEDALDPGFLDVLPKSVRWAVVPADQVERLAVTGGMARSRSSRIRSAEI